MNLASGVLSSCLCFPATSAGFFTFFCKVVKDYIQTCHDTHQRPAIPPGVLNKNEHWSPTSSSRRSPVHSGAVEVPRRCLTLSFLQKQLVPAAAPSYTSVFKGRFVPSSGTSVAILILTFSLCRRPTMQSHGGTICSEGTTYAVCHQH